MTRQSDPFALLPVLNDLETATERLLAGIGDLPVTGSHVPEEIRNWLDQYRFDSPVPSADLLADVEQALRTWGMQVAHPRYFGLFNPPAMPPGVAGDALAALYNVQVGAWAHSPVGNEIERHVLQFFADRLGIPLDQGTAHFTSGGQEANTTAVAAALAQAFPAMLDGGVRALPGAPRLYVSRHAHHSFLKAAKFLGLGTAAVVEVDADDGARMRPDALAAAVAADRAAGHLPFLVVGTAGTTGEGVIDPLPAIADIAVREGLWFHADAAWGGSALLVPELKDLFAGIERADSATWDAHKGLNVPMGAGMFFSRHADPVLRMFAVDTGYVPPPREDVSDKYATTAQWSRRFIGLKVFLTLARYGEAGLAEMIRQQVRIAEVLRTRATERGWAVVNRTRLPLVCLRHPALPDAPAVNAAAQHIQHRGLAWISALRLPGGETVLRACITSPRATEADVEVLVEELAREVAA